MKKYAYLCNLWFVLMVLACVPSIHPLYTDEVLTYDPALLGNWKETNEDGGTWQFTSSNGHSYHLLYADNNKKEGKFKVNLLKLNDSMFLDLYPNELQPAANEFYQFHFLPIHTFMRIEIGEAQLKMAPLNPEWLKEFLEENPDAIAHELRDDAVILTASPVQLQRFVLAHEKTEKAFGEPAQLIRE